MNLYLKFDTNAIVAAHLALLLEQKNVSYKKLNFNEIEISNDLSDAEFVDLSERLNQNGIEIIENKKIIQVQKIKDVILEMIQNSDAIAVKTSVYLSDKIGLNYGTISNLFSEVTYTSIENFIIIQKTEAVKQLIIANELTLTEIAYKFNYSSVAHLSTQFKNTTGLTPTAFQRIIAKRQEIINQNQ